MASNKRKQKKNNILIFILIVCFLVLLAFIIKQAMKRTQVNQEENFEVTIEESQKNEDEKIINTLKKMKERDRMEYYFSVFLDYIESNEYEKAYELLYSEFKENYFPTLDSFSQYIQNTFSEMSDIEHENIERNGDVYVLWICITDTINGSPNDKKEMNVVIKENDYNDFVMSFSVI